MLLGGVRGLDPEARADREGEEEAAGVAVASMGDKDEKLLMTTSGKCNVVRGVGE